ncbi:Imidazolonepropionase [Saccharopolyspora shandongensis]|uniref:Imidazolonepropionase n=1 Tax=Saccharopolyspora shandongensis TaxID=418495 RepID=A0A1H3RZM7_9PSEU|nr:amidohydrolase family protein [Saccharopolyspora shandongensis]SDZ31233.1 Imidazolonepropionase [Saccharopolyspora shandongensis]
MTHRLDGIRVWDGTRDVGVSALAWAPDRIEEVTPAAEERWPELCVLPGLVDTHVHLLGFAGEGDGGTDTFTFPLVTTREEQTLHAAANAQKAMRRGVTTLRDLAGDQAQAAARRAFDLGIMPGPRLLVSGPVGMTAGHGDLFVPPAVKERAPLADSPDECRKLVRTWARAGLTGIKIFTSGGVLSIGDKVGWRNHTREELRATIDEAHALGMLVSAHAHSEVGIQIALEEGADSIEHGTELTAAQAEVLAARGTPVGPTLLINEIIAQGKAAASAEARDKAAELVARRDELFRAAARAGVRFVLGTDASGYFVEFGDQLAEVVRMTEVLGFDAETALRAATSDAAASMGLGNVTGRIAPGLGADFIVLRGRPWERAADLTPENIVAVVCRGVLVAGELPS